MSDMTRFLRYEEITQIVQILAQLGITKVKITGGEPLVRHGCTDLIREIKEIPGIEMVTLTTNGILLQSMLPKLLEAGVDAVNVSLDTFQRARYEHLTEKMLMRWCLPEFRMHTKAEFR